MRPKRCAVKKKSRQDEARFGAQGPLCDPAVFQGGVKRMEKPQR